MKNDITRDDCCLNCTDRHRACHDTCPAHKMRLARANAKRQAVNEIRKENHYWGCLTQKSFSTIR